MRGPKSQNPETVLKERAEVKEDSSGKHVVHCGGNQESMHPNTLSSSCRPLAKAHQHLEGSGVPAMLPLVLTDTFMHIGER